MGFYSFGLDSLNLFSQYFKTTFEFYGDFKEHGIHNFGHVKDFYDRAIQMGKSASGVGLIVYNGYRGYKLVQLFLEKRRNKLKVEKFFKDLSKK